MIVVVMGAAGAGKTSIGRRLASELGWEFLDADDLHPPENVAKMAAGVPLTDPDREPWLQRIRSVLAGRDDVVLACSALRRAFRARLVEGHVVRFVHLRVDLATTAERVRERKGHFFAPELIQSQFDALEEPEDAIVVDASQPPDAIVRNVKALLMIK